MNSYFVVVVVVVVVACQWLAYWLSLNFSIAILCQTRPASEYPVKRATHFASNTIGYTVMLITPCQLKPFKSNSWSVKGFI